MAASDLDAFMETMVAASVPISCDAAERFARERYGLRATATRLTGERDENFKLTCLDGREYVLKLANAEEAPAVTDLPTAALLHVERADPGFPCPRVLRDVDGLTSSRFVDVRTDADAGAGRTARVLTYLPGKTLRSSARSSTQRAACGRVAARLGLALQGFTHSAAARPLIWDLRHVGMTLRLLDELVEFPEREAVAALIAAIDSRIQAEFGQLRQQVIHNDMNDMNVLVDSEDGAVIVGVIDFGDLVHTAMVADVAVLAADQIVTGRGGASRDSVTDVVMAYHNVVPLLPPELAMLNTLIAGRILSDVLIASWHRRRNPDGTHYADLDPEFIRARVQLAAEVFGSEAPSAELLRSRANADSSRAGPPGATP
jgi:Ser/Thr protein kinase RdoA (MazF antagonist)